MCLCLVNISVIELILLVWNILIGVAAQLDDGKGLSQTIANIKDANKRGALHFAAREGKTEVCKYLLEELKLDVNTKDEDGNCFFFVCYSDILD